MASTAPKRTPEAKAEAKAKAQIREKRERDNAPALFPRAVDVPALLQHQRIVRCLHNCNAAAGDVSLPDVLGHEPSAAERAASQLLFPSGNPAHCAGPECTAHDRFSLHPEAAHGQITVDLETYKHAVSVYSDKLEELVRASVPRRRADPFARASKINKGLFKEVSAHDRDHITAITMLESYWVRLNKDDFCPVFALARLCRILVDLFVKWRGVRNVEVQERIEWGGRSANNLRGWMEGQGRAYAAPLLNARGRKPDTFRWDADGEDGDVVRWSHRIDKKNREAVKKLDARVKVLKNDVELKKLLLDEEPEHQEDVVEQLTVKLATWLNRAVSQHHDRVYGRCLNEHHGEGEGDAGAGAGAGADSSAAGPSAAGSSGNPPHDVAARRAARRDAARRDATRSAAPTRSAAGDCGPATGTSAGTARGAGDGSAGSACGAARGDGGGSGVAVGTDASAAGAAGAADTSAAGDAGGEIVATAGNGGMASTGASAGDGGVADAGDEGGNVGKKRKRGKKTIT